MPSSTLPDHPGRSLLSECAGVTVVTSSLEVTIRNRFCRPDFPLVEPDSSYVLETLTLTLNVPVCKRSEVFIWR